MAEIRPEAKRDIVADRAGRTLRDILMSGAIDPQIGEAFSDLVLGEELNVHIAEFIGAQTDAAFHLHIGRLDGYGFVVDPFFSIDIERGLTASEDDFTSELVREVLIAGQYPDLGYERSMKEVYADTFRRQAVFLNAHGIGPVKNDPRTTDYDDLFYALSFGTRYFHDPSYDMYEAALPEIAVKDENEEEARQQIQGNKRFFVKARELVSAKILDGLDKSLYDREERSRASYDAAVIIAGQAIQLKRDGLLA